MDPIAEAAATLDAAPSSTEPGAAPQEAGTPETGESLADASSEKSSDAPAIPAVTGNVLVNSTPTVDAPVIDEPANEPEAAVAAVAEAEPLPRESHLMLLEAKFAAALAKLRNGERVFLDELDAIYTHVQAVI